jgi:hypothetical protein
MQMKRTIKKILTSILPLLAVAISGCEKSDESPSYPGIETDGIITVPIFIEDENGDVPADMDTRVFETRKHNPVVDTEGKQLSLGEFSTVKGTATIVGKAGGTQVTLNLTGLIPNGLYTVWNVTFASPGFDPSVEGMNIIGLGVIGKIDGSENHFRASATGTGQIAAFTPSGPLSMQGEISEHPFVQEVEWHLVGAYHMDDKAHGPDLGPDGTAVEQFAFIIKP